MTALALVLPGSGYGPDGPALLIPALALEQQGATVVRVSYPAWRPDGWTPAEMAPFVDQVRSAVGAAIDEAPVPSGGWQRVTVIAKSLGTLVLSLMDGPIVAGADHRAVWLTPLFGAANPALDRGSKDRLEAAGPAQRAGAIAKGWASLFVAGGADQYHDPAGHDAVVLATGGASLVIEGADHSLEVHGDVLATVDGFRRLAEAVLAFDSS